MAVKGYLKNLLGENNFIVIDGGARNGTLEIPNLAPYCTVYGFEPNQVEYEKLLTGNTDLKMASGISSPAYAKLIYSNSALGSHVGQGTLYITHGPGASSMLQPITQVLSNFIDEYSCLFDIVGEISVECTTLEAVMEKQNVHAIDYLKLDTQGSEMDILLASEQLLLSGISVIKMEVEFIQLYKGQKVFGECELELRKRGYELLDLVFTDENRIASVSKELEGKKKLVWADAIFVKIYGSDSPRDRILKQAIILMELGYIDYGLSLIQWAEKPIISSINQHYGSAKTLTKRQWIHRRVLNFYRLIRSFYIRIMRL